MYQICTQDCTNGYVPETRQHLARMIGHADIRELNTYYNATAEDIAKYL